MCSCSEWIIIGSIILMIILLFINKIYKYCENKKMLIIKKNNERIKLQKEINDLKVEIEYEKDEKKEKFLKNEKIFLEKKLKLLENPNKCCIYLP